MGGGGGGGECQKVHDTFHTGKLEYVQDCNKAEKFNIKGV